MSADITMSADISLVLSDVGELFGRVKEAFRPEYHLGLAYLSAVCRAKNFEVDLVDMQVEMMNEGDLRQHLMQVKPKAVGFTLLTPLFAHTKELIRATRETLPDAIIIGGGSHGTALPLQTMSEVPELDVLCYGESELTLIEVLDNIAESKNLDKVKGICRRRGKEILTNPPRTFIENLDSLPFAWRRPDRIKKYLAPIYFHSDEPYINILSSRGCPYMCSFCGQEVTFGNRVRARSAQNVVDEMEYHYKENDIRIFFFDDSTFVVDSKRVVSICKEIESRIPNIRWGAMGRLNLCDETMLKAMRRAGCEMLHFGVESGDQKILDAIHKQIDLSKAGDAIKRVRKAGIMSNASFILGLPGDNPETISKTIEFAIHLDSDFVSFSMATPYPGTEFFELARKEGFDPQDWKKFGISRYTEPVYVPVDLTRDELLTFYRIAYRKFYRRPKLILRELLKLDNYLNIKRSIALARKLILAQ